MSITIDDQQSEISSSWCECVICGSRAIGFNFGVLTCAPCKAFFRRNARRKEILQFPCQHSRINVFTINNNVNSIQTIYYLQTRRCTSCRLRRCFYMGMKEELVRTDEQNIRHKQLVDRNRRIKELLKQKQEEQLLALPRSIVQNNIFLHESDWCHLSNIVSSYETYCLKPYLQQRSVMFIDENKSYSHEYMPIKPYTALPLSVSKSLLSFFRSLPAFHTLSQRNQIYLNKNNLNLLICPTIFELNQTCYSESWQMSLHRATWQLICGPELHEQFMHVDNLAEKLLITDPIIIRLWLIVLFYSSSLSCSYEINTTLQIPKKRSAVSDIQNAYVTLLWNYLLHRYGSLAAIHIYLNLIHVYLEMQRFACDACADLRSRNRLTVTHDTINHSLTLNIRDH